MLITAEERLAIPRGSCSPHPKTNCYPVIASEAKQSHSAQDRLRVAISGDNVAMDKQYYVYIMTNTMSTVLYTGVTNDLKRRVYEHKEKLASGFTRKYNITKLVYCEVFEDIENAIWREKQIKAGSRRKKIELVNSMNREWRDLYKEL